MYIHLIVCTRTPSDGFRVPLLLERVGGVRQQHRY